MSSQDTSHHGQHARRHKVVRAVRLVQQTTEAMLVQLDTWQQPRAWASVPVAVVAKYRDDHGGRWATLLAHYGFLSLFPFLLVLVTVLGATLSGNPAWQTRILDTALADVPVLGEQLRADVTSLGGSTAATIVGVVLATYGGGAVLRTAHAAMDVVWAAPAQSLSAYLRSHLRVAAVGMMLLVATLVAAVAGSLTTSAGSLPGEARAISLGFSALLSAAVFLLAFHSLTSARPSGARSCRALSRERWDGRVCTR